MAREFGRTQRVADYLRQELARLLQTLRAQVTRTVNGLPAHADYVARYCAGARQTAA
jgi:tryptophan halogenase